LKENAKAFSLNNLGVIRGVLEKKFWQKKRGTSPGKYLFAI